MFGRIQEIFAVRAFPPLKLVDSISNFIKGMSKFQPVVRKMDCHNFLVAYHQPCSDKGEYLYIYMYVTVYAYYYVRVQAIQSTNMSG